MKNRIDKKVLLTGGGGFIGGHLKKRLADEGYDVMELPRSYLHQPSELERFFILHQPNYIFHLAAYGNQSFQKDEYQTALVNYMGLVDLLVTSKGISYKAFIHFGSSSEYTVEVTLRGSGLEPANPKYAQN